MKTRIGFVSNSSSSSFIVVADRLDETKITLETSVNALVDKTFETEQEVKEYYISQYYWSEDKTEDFEQKWFHFMTDDDRDFEYHRDTVETILGALIAGKEVAICSADSEAGGVSSYIYENEDLGELKIDGGTVIEM